jgi:hypothetical protein
MDLKLYTRLVLRKSVGRYLSRHRSIYRQPDEEFRYLKDVVPAFMAEKLTDTPADKRVLYVSMGWYDAKTEAIYLKAIEALGYEPYVLTCYDPYVSDIFRLYGIRRTYFYEDYFKKISLNKLKKEAENYISGFKDKEAILGLKRNGISIGKFAASSFMKMTRGSSFDLSDEHNKILLTEQLTHSLRAEETAEMILSDTQPDLVFVIDRGYTPVGQLFDACMNKSIPVISRNSSHKSGWEIIKRYSSSELSVVHPQSLSKDSWDYVKNMPWDDSKWKELYRELAETYGSGDWFSEVGTQFNKKMYSRENLLLQLQLDTGKKTAVIFPHMFWDATFFWGEDLFNDYYEWFVNVLKVAAENKNLNWIIKIHPANVVKAKRDNYKGEHVELKAVYETLGDLPGHIKVIVPESDINTFSLFEIMDYCLTVRGTIGIESAMMGINTLTAGTGRYDRLGFTHDFNSKEDYLESIRSLEDILPMNAEKIELARRFAFGIFKLRPIELDLLEYGFSQDEKGSIRFKPLFKNREEFESSSFIKGLRNFVSSGSEDFLNPSYLPHTS